MDEGGSFTAPFPQRLLSPATLVIDLGPSILGFLGYGFSLTLRARQTAPFI